MPQKSASSAQNFWAPPPPPWSKQQHHTWAATVIRWLCEILPLFASYSAIFGNILNSTAILRAKNCMHCPLPLLIKKIGDAVRGQWIWGQSFWGRKKPFLSSYISFLVNWIFHRKSVIASSSFMFAKSLFARLTRRVFCKKGFVHRRKKKGDQKSKCPPFPTMVW